MRGNFFTWSTTACAITKYFLCDTNAVARSVCDRLPSCLRYGLDACPLRISQLSS